MMLNTFNDQRSIPCSKEMLLDSKLDGSFPVVIPSVAIRRHHFPLTREINFSAANNGGPSFNGSVVSEEEEKGTGYGRKINSCSKRSRSSRNVIT